MRLNELFENNHRNRGYEPGFASPHAPSLGGRRQNDEPDGVNNIEVSINGRVWKIFAGVGPDSSPEFFRQKQDVDAMCKRKTAATGKKWSWGVTGEPATNEGLNEFAPSGDDDGDHGPDEEEILHRLASIWWLGNEQQMARAERALASMGWEIGEDEGYDDGGVFVVRAGDVNGKSYISWPHEDLQLSEAAPVNLNDPQYQQIDQPSRDFGQRTFPVTGGDSITGQPLPPKFAPGKETVPRLPSADNKTTSSSTGTSTTIDSDHVSADQIGNVFKAVQDVDQEYRDKDAAKRADPAKAAQMKQSYQDRIVNPEFMNDLSDTDAEPVTPAKPVYNNPDADTGDTVGNKINSVGDQKGVAASTTTSSPPPPAKMPAKQITSVKPPAAGSWQELAQLNKSTIPNPDRIYPGQKIKITPYGDEYVVKPGDTLSSIAKSMKGMDTPQTAPMSPPVLGRRLKENTAQNDLYQILRNAGLTNTP